MCKEVVTDIRRNELTGQPYPRLEQFHALMNHPPRYVQGYVYRATDEMPERYKEILNVLDSEIPIPPWAPNQNVLIVPGIPSRMKDRKSRRIITIAYQRRDTHRRNITNPLKYKSRQLHKFTMWICGPRGTQENSCPLGARTNCPDTHVGAGILIAGVLSYNPDLHNSTHRKANFQDAGNALPVGDHEGMD